MINKNYTLDQATVVLFNPSGPMRSTLREAVHALGFRNVLDFGDLQRARTVISERAPDLLMLDLDREKEEVCKLIRGVRQAKFCADPFVVIVALSWHPSMDAVNNSMESGVDDIITMPISIKLLSDRINALIAHRKQFVVTSSYLGPDRRSAARSSEDPIGLGTIQVPNNLRYKAVGDRDAAASQEAIDAVQAKINNHRLNRHAQRIAWLIDEFLKKHAADMKLAGPQILTEIKVQIEELADDLKAEGQDHLLHICESMRAVHTAIKHAPSKQLYELLKVHAMATTAALMERDGAAEMVLAALEEARRRIDKAKLRSA